jgi:hypothetical protein
LKPHQAFEIRNKKNLPEHNVPMNLKDEHYSHLLCRLYHQKSEVETAKEKEFGNNKYER